MWLKILNYRKMDIIQLFSKYMHMSINLCMPQSHTRTGLIKQINHLVRKEMIQHKRIVNFFITISNCDDNFQQWRRELEYINYALMGQLRNINQILISIVQFVINLIPFSQNFQILWFHPQWAVAPGLAEISFQELDPSQCVFCIHQAWWPRCTIETAEYILRSEQEHKMIKQ